MFKSKIAVWIGIIASATIFLGCLFKAFHLSGAAFMFVAGMLLFSFGFIPLLIWELLKNKHWVWALFSAFLSALMMGALFKVMHWPYANFIIAWGISIILFGIIPLHFFKILLNPVNESYPPEIRRRDVFLGALMLAFFSSWYLLMDLSSIPSVYSLPS